MELFDLRGKVALVTGGNGGIGLGIARGLAQAGADIVVGGRDATKNEAAVKELSELGVRVISVVADVCDNDQVQRMTDETVNQLGGLDILIANAGTNVRKRPEEYSMEEWHRLVDTNLTSVFACCQSVYPAMKARGGGKIITIGSMTCIFGFDMAPVYAATKGAVLQLTKSLASAWAQDNIQVNCIEPGFIDTDLTVVARRNIEGLHEKVVNRTPARRWGRPDDMAGAAVFLASPASDFVTGTGIPVDGGFSSSIF
jgi:2-dehydro-3-deoxy-D-gluconate 5-dehydrogenase